MKFEEIKQIGVDDGLQTMDLNRLGERGLRDYKWFDGIRGLGERGLGKSGL